MGCLNRRACCAMRPAASSNHTDYGADVMLTLLLPQGGRMALREKLTELSAGTLTLEVAGEEYRGGPREDLP